MSQRGLLRNASRSEASVLKSRGGLTFIDDDHVGYFLATAHDSAAAFGVHRPIRSFHTQVDVANEAVSFSWIVWVGKVDPLDSWEWKRANWALWMAQYEVVGRMFLCKLELVC